MDVQEIAKQYADALYALGEEKDILPELERQITQFGQLYREQEKFRIFLEAPHMDASEKKSLLKAVFREKASRDFLHFLYILAEKNRYLIFWEIEVEFCALIDKKEGRFRAQVTTARKVNKNLAQKIAKAIESKTGRKILVDYKVDPELLGGIVLRVEDLQIDGSLRNRLGKYRKVLMEKRL